MLHLGAKDFTRIKRLLDLDTVMKKTPWDVLFILGGGYAIAAGCKVYSLTSNGKMTTVKPIPRGIKQQLNNLSLVLNLYLDSATNQSTFL